MTKRVKKSGPPPEPIKLKGEGPSASEQVIADRNITAESLADYEAGKTFSWDELLSKIDAAPHWDEVLAALEMDRAMATQTLALIAALRISGEDVEAGRIYTLEEVLTKIRGGDPIKNGVREHLRRKHKKPAPPGDIEGILSELQRLRTEVEELRAERDRWMLQWQRAANELLRRTPPSTIKLPGEGDQTAAVLNILDLRLEAKATRDLDPTEVGRSVRLHPDDDEGLPTDAPTMDEIQAEVREVRRTRAGRKLASEIDGPSVGREFGADDADLD